MLIIVIFVTVAGKIGAGTVSDNHFNKKIMKIYEFIWDGGEIDWVFAYDIADAKEFYINHTGCGDLNDCNIMLIPRPEWGNHYITGTMNLAEYAKKKYAN